MPAVFKKIRNFSQKNFSLLTWIGVVLLGSVLICFYIILLSTSLGHIRESVVDIHLEIAQSAKNKIEGFLDENIRALNDLAQILSVVEGDQEKKVIIDRFLKERQVFGQIVVTNTRGQEIMKRSQFLIFNSGDLKDISWSESFVRSMEGEIYLSTVYASENSKPFLTIGLAVKPSPDQTSGVLLAELSLQKVWDIVSGIKVRPAGVVYLIDSRGYLIAHPDAKLVLKQTNLLARWAVEEVIVNKKNVLGLDKNEEYSNEKGEKVYVVGLPLEKNGWGIFVEEPARDAWDSYQLIKNMGLVSIFIEAGLFLTLSFGVLALEKFNKKLEEKVKIRTRELEESKSILEIKVLARTRELGEFAKSLEAQVSERTKQLEEKIKELERFNKLTIGRELRMIELKKEIEKIKQKIK